MMRALRSRFVVVPATIAVLVGFWNLYVTLNAHGLVAGRVVDAGGRPVAGATVLLFERDFINQNERDRTTTDAAGRFRFTSNRSHLVQVEARKDQAKSQRETVRLWFRAQDTDVPQALRLGAG